MTQEEKQLLLKVLCELLPYKLHCHVFRLNGNIKENDDILYGVIGDNVVTLKSDKDECLMYYQIKPYLRSMSSMTEEEEAFVYNGHIEFWVREDYCNKHFLDYRGLIPIGLAIEAPDGMYELK